MMKALTLSLVVFFATSPAWSKLPVAAEEKKEVKEEPAQNKKEMKIEIDREGIRKVFYQERRLVRNCYEEANGEKGQLAGIVKLNFDIQKDGSVAAAKVDKDSSLKDKKLNDCLVAELNNFTFPKPPKNQVVNVSYPIAFAAK